MLTNEERAKRKAGWWATLNANADWMLDAECRHHPDSEEDEDEKLWYPTKSSHMPKKARNICNNMCSVRDVCEAYYMLTETNTNRIGNAMGMTPSERKNYYRTGTLPKPRPTEVAPIPVPPEPVQEFSIKDVKGAARKPHINFDDFEAMAAGEKLDPGTASALQRLRDKGYKVAVPE